MSSLNLRETCTVSSEKERHPLRFSCSIKVLLPVFAGSHLDDTRHTSLDTRFAQTRYHHRSTLLGRSSEHREELCNPALGSVCLFDQVYRHTPPSKQCREHPKVCRYFNADADTVSVCEEAAGDCCADGEGEEEGCEDNVTGGCCDCLLWIKSASVDENEEGRGSELTPTQVNAANTTNQDASSGR